jgi:two-component system cell cycle sensor histidine kinase/response regulator CckA
MSRSPATRPKDLFSSLPAQQAGQETILLVEDEPAVLMLTKVILERLGYAVIDAVSGVAALELWNSQHPAVDLLMTDMIMPHGVTGRDLAEKLRAQKPDLKILFTTGYSPSSVARGMNLIEGVNFIQKPYSPQALSSVIRACLERPPLALY